MANHLLGADPDRHPPLPLAAVPDDDALRGLAAESLVVRRLRELVRWLGDGRSLTTTGRLRLADARELVALLETGDVLDPVIGDRVFKTRSSDELYQLTVLVAWARAARVVRVVKGRLVPVKSAAKVLADPLALSRRAFTGLFELGEAVRGAGWAESVLRWRFMALLIAPEPVGTGELRQLAYQGACDGLGFGPGSDEQERGWRMRAWCARNPATASAELRALAERTDDPEHRRHALAYA